MDAGHQVSGELWKEIMEKILLEQKDENIIFDAFIRNERNKEIFDRVMPEYKVIFFNLSKEKSMERLLWRMYDPETQETFPAGTLVNPKNGNTLIKRQDDNEQSIMTRINAFIDYTLPIVEVQKKEGKVIEIQADQTPEAVHSDLVSQLHIS